MKSFFLSFWHKIKYTPLVVGILSLAWFLARVIPKPTRAYYPCQRAAFYNIIAFFGIGVPPFLVKFKRQIVGCVKRYYMEIISLSLVFVLLIPFYYVYKAEKERRLIVAGSTGIMTSPITGQVKGITTLQSLVSIQHDPLISYGELSPYNQVDNSAYDLVWQAVEELNLGTHESPLEELILDGETVLIELNLVNSNEVGYTHPAVARPVIDMAIEAGAAVIYIGDGGSGFDDTEQVIKDTGYQNMIDSLQNQYPSIVIQMVNLNQYASDWHWVNLDTYSAFTNSGYTNAQMANSMGGSIFDSQYFSTSDRQGVNPNGQVMGWYAISDKVIEADVVINLPKMKNHWTNIITYALKNLVGTTLCSTYDAGDNNWGRIPHCETNTPWGDYNNSYGNDILWRSTLDLNRIMLYLDKNFVMQETRQRRYLNILDAVVANQVHAGGGVPYELKAIVASTDPLALDAVAARLARYNFEAIPGIYKIDSVAGLTIGTNDRQNIVILGDTIDQKFDHLFQYYYAWGDKYEEGDGLLAEEEGLPIYDLDPPQIGNVQSQISASTILVSADIQDGLVAFLSYENQGQFHVWKMDKNGSQYSLNIPQTSTQIKLVAQDNYFNSSIYDLPLSQPYINLTKSSEPSQVKAGDKIIYTIDYQNDSSFQALDVIVEDSIPASTTYIQGTATQGGQFLNNQIVWDLGSLAPGAGGSLSFEVEVN